MHSNSKNADMKKNVSALLRSPDLVFGKLALQINRIADVIAPEAAKPAENA
jgi:hypothetical protein